MQTVQTNVFLLIIYDYLIWIKMCLWEFASHIYSKLVTTMGWTDRFHERLRVLEVIQARADEYQICISNRKNLQHLLRLLI